MELIAFPAIYMSTHAEHLCPPPVVVLLWLILFSSMMIMISLAVKYKCKFTSIFPDKPLGKKASLYFSSRRRGTSLKENTLNRRHYQFCFCHPPDFVTLSSICLCVVLLCMWTHQGRQHPKARLCHTCWVSLKQQAEQVLSVGVFCFFSLETVSWVKCLLTISCSCTLGLSLDRCLSTGIVWSISTTQEC